MKGCVQSSAVEAQMGKHNTGFKKSFMKNDNLAESCKVRRSEQK